MIKSAEDWYKWKVLYRHVYIHSHLS
jgi:hypothetical protein